MLPGAVAPSPSTAAGLSPDRTSSAPAGQQAESRPASSTLLSHGQQTSQQQDRVHELPMQDNAVYLTGSSSFSDEQEEGAENGDDSSGVIPAADNTPAEAAAGKLSEVASLTDEQLDDVRGDGDDAAESAGTAASHEGAEAADDMASGLDESAGQVGSPSEAAAQSPTNLAKSQSGLVIASENGLQTVRSGSGIMDEYLRRMHFPKQETLGAANQPHSPGVPQPPQGLPTRGSIGRRWTKTSSYTEGKDFSVCSTMQCSICWQTS